MPIQAAHFQLVRELVAKETSIVLEPDRAYLVESRLSVLARHEGMQTLEQLFEKLQQTRDPKLTRRVIEAMTTNETSFFRDAAYFDAFKQTILPDLINKRKAEKKVTIWCAATSSGQEPYSLAMILSEFQQRNPGYQFRIVGTDYCESMVERSKSGIYSQLEINRGLPAQLLVNNFTRQGTVFVVKDELKRFVEFRQMNLAAPTWSIGGPVDMVFLRNVLIYFNTQTKKEILNRVKRLLRSDGFLVLGSTESLINVTNEFERFEVGRAAFYRIRAT